MEDLTEENKNVHAILATSVDYKIVKKRIDTGFFWASENFDSEQQIAGEESDYGRVANCATRQITRGTFGCRVQGCRLQEN